MFYTSYLVDALSFESYLSQRRPKLPPCIRIHYRVYYFSARPVSELLAPRHQPGLLTCIRTVLLALNFMHGSNVLPPGSGAERG